MTVAQNQPEPPRHEGSDLARDHAHAVTTMRRALTDRRGEARSFRSRADQLGSGVLTLLQLLEMPRSERTDGTHFVLHNEKGDLLEGQLRAYLKEILRGANGLQACQALLDAADEAAEAQVDEVSTYLHGFADRQLAREASPVHRGELPPAVAVPPQGPAAPGLPKRMPQRPAIGPQPTEPPMFPPAPPETDVEQTGAIVAKLRDSGVHITAEVEASMRKDGKSAAAPDMGQPAPAGFGPAAVRMGDTQRLPVVVDEPDRTGEALADLAAGDASDGEQVVPFFAIPAGHSDASPAVSRPSRSADAGDDDAA